MEAIARRTSGGGAAQELPMALLPETSYRKTLDSRFTLDQTTYTVSACPGNAFRRFIPFVSVDRFLSRMKHGNLLTWKSLCLCSMLIVAMLRGGIL